MLVCPRKDLLLRGSQSAVQEDRKARILRRQKASKKIHSCMLHCTNANSCKNSLYTLFKHQTIEIPSLIGYPGRWTKEPNGSNGIAYGPNGTRPFAGFDQVWRLVIHIIIVLFMHARSQSKGPVAPLQKGGQRQLHWSLPIARRRQVILPSAAFFNEWFCGGHQPGFPPLESKCGLLQNSFGFIAAQKAIC